SPFLWPPSAGGRIERPCRPASVGNPLPHARPSGGVADMTSSPGPEKGPLEAVVEAIVQRCRRGDRPTLEEYTRRSPELAHRLGGLFPALVMLENVGSVD